MTDDWDSGPNRIQEPDDDIVARKPHEPRRFRSLERVCPAAIVLRKRPCSKPETCTKCKEEGGHETRCDLCEATLGWEMETALYHAPPVNWTQEEEAEWKVGQRYISEIIAESNDWKKVVRRLNRLIERLGKRGATLPAKSKAARKTSGRQGVLRELYHALEGKDSSKCTPGELYRIWMSQRGGHDPPCRIRLDRSSFRWCCEGVRRLKRKSFKRRWRLEQRDRVARLQAHGYIKPSRPQEVADILEFVAYFQAASGISTSRIGAPHCKTKEAKSTSGPPTRRKEDDYAPRKKGQRLIKAAMERYSLNHPESPEFGANLCYLHLGEWRRVNPVAAGEDVVRRGGNGGGTGGGGGGPEPPAHIDVNQPDEEITKDLVQAFAHTLKEFDWNHLLPEVNKRLLALERKMKEEGELPRDDEGQPDSPADPNP